MASDNPIADPMSHTIDSDVIHLPFQNSIDVHGITSNWLGNLLSWAGIHGLSKFMLIELIVFALMLVILIPMASRIRRLGRPRGLIANLVEAVCVFIRDNAAVPAIGKEDADKYLPYLWTVFFFILINNLFGMLPWLGSPTGALGVTTALAACSLFLIHGSGLFRHGVVGYFKTLVPHVPMALYPLMLLIELISHVIKPTVLAFRLFVNMVAGHTLLFVILCFVSLSATTIFYYFVTPMSVGGIVIFSLLEILVAFLQAYVFTFLSAIFIGAALHPQH